jgi:hypothetical protein
MYPNYVYSTMNESLLRANIFKERRRILKEKMKLKRMHRPRIIKKIRYRRGCKYML